MYRYAEEETKARKRAMAKASLRFRAVWMRSGRDALTRWRKNTQAKKIILAATEIAVASSHNAAADGANNNKTPGSGTGTGGDKSGTGGDKNAEQVLITGRVDTCHIISQSKHQLVTV